MLPQTWEDVTVDGLEKWMEQNKKLCVVTGIFGLLVSPFLWPFFLAIIFQSLSLAVPIVLAWLIVKQPWREKEDQDEKTHERVQHGNNEDSGKVSSDRTQTDDIPKSGKKTEQESVNLKSDAKRPEEPDEEGCLAILWYQNEGRERISRIKRRLDKEGKKEFSVSKDGICTVRQENGFQRVGILRGYPGNRILSVQPELRKDGFSIRKTGDYMWISWKKEE